MTTIVHITTVHPRLDTRIFRKECTTLKAAGYDVHLIVADGRGDAVRDGVIFHDVGSASGRLKRILALPWRAFMKARSLAPDIVHIHDPELLPIAALLSAMGYHTIYDAHEDLPRAILSKHWIPPRLRSIVAGLSECVEDFCAARFAAVVAATPHIAKRYKTIQSQTISVTNYPVLADTNAPAFRAPEPRTFIYIGGISRKRAAREMVLATHLAGARLILVGPFEDAALGAELRALPEWSCVEYRGVVDHEKLINLMSRAHAGLLLFFPEPNHINSVPNKLFEYMSGGLPIICSDFEDWRAIVTQRGIGYVANPCNPVSIAAAMTRILEDPIKSKEMGLRASKIVAAEFRWQNEANKLIELYRILTASI